MPNLQSLCPASQLSEGQIKTATLCNGTRIALYNLEGRYYATDDTCTHEKASLCDDGMVDGTNVICGWHLCSFDIASGEANASPCSEPLRTYPVTLIDGVLHVEC
jgi:nitrite reductase/ring-hydroxylating ferredoxin subunit